MAALRGEIEIIQELEGIIQMLEMRVAQIKRKSHQAWGKFPERLATQAHALLEQAEKMSELAPMPAEDRSLRKFDSPREWQRSLS